MQKQSAYFVEEREIDIKTMLWRSLKHWRIIFIGAVIGAILACGIKYKADTAAAQSAINNQIEAANAPAVTIEYLEEKLGESQVSAVWNALEYWIFISNKKEYMENSVWMNLNAYAEDAVYLTYQISAENPGRMINRCSRYLTGAEMIASLADEMELSIEERYITELLSMPLTDNASYFTIRVCAGSPQECQTLADAVEKWMGNYIKDLERDYEETQISLIGREAKVEVDSALASAQSAYNTEIYNMLNIYNAYMGALGSEQLQLYDMLLEREAETEVSLYAVGETAEEETASGETSAVEIDTTIHVRPSIRMLFIGFVAGALIAYALLMLFYTISKKIHGTDEVKYLFGLSTFGTVNTITVGKKRVFSGIDVWIDRLSQGRGHYLDYEHQLDLITANIRIVCEKKGIHHVFAFGSDIKAIPEVSLQNMKEKLETYGISIEYGEGILLSPKSLEDASKTGAAILFEVDEKTKCEEIAKELNVCRQGGIEILGAVLAQVF